MKKITAFVGSARKGHTYDAATQLLHNLQSQGDIEGEVVRLSEYHLETCRGCKVCFDKGEEHCPLKDDRDVLIDKMMASDGVILATPNYAFQVSAIVKTFLDRLAFALHRPRFFGKTFTGVVTQGIYGGNKIVSYLDFVGNALGYNTVKGSVLVTLDPMTDKQQQKMDEALAAQARRFYAQMTKPAYPVPGVIELMLFRYSRTKIKLELDEAYCDYRYYADNGWLDSDFYYPTRLGVVKRGAGKLFDTVATRMTKAR
jgi:multimeric flavodoxin WrbA